MKIDEETGIVKKRTRHFMQGGSSTGPGFFPFLMMVGGFFGIIPGAMIVDSGASLIACTAVGISAGFGTARALVMADFVDDAGYGYDTKFTMTLPQMLKMAVFMPVKIKGVAPQSYGPKYLNEMTESDENYIKRLKRDYTVGAEHRVELKVMPVHFTIDEEWEKTELGLWDEVMDTTLKNGSYAADGNSEVKNAKQLLSGVPVMKPKELKQLMG